MLALALTARFLRAGQIAPRDAALIGHAIASAGGLPERNALDWLREALYLATTGEYGPVEDAERDIRAHFDRYDAHAAELPPSI